MVSVGQFFILGFDGMIVPPALKQLHDRHGLGGVILFDRNIESNAQVRQLTEELRALVSNEPFAICVDQEGGRYQRLRPPHFSAYPPACDVTRANAAATAWAMGRELAHLGITMDFAPVLDVNTNGMNPIIGSRSFGPDPKQVGEVGAIFVRSLQEQGVMACGKHFPGHGDTSEDSHQELPVVYHGVERLRAVELVPFHAVIGAGLLCIMTAHVLYPALDPEWPATFSEAILGGILRREWGYDELIVTDDLGMAGALTRSDLPEACVQAFAAGCDLLLICECLERHAECLAALSDAIARSPALQRRAAESSHRIRHVL